MSTQTDFDRRQVLAFRLAQHNLSRRLPAVALTAAVGVAAIQNAPPGSAALSLLARLAALTPDLVRQALEQDKTLLQTWSLRGSPHIFPTRDAAIFTLGLLPSDETSLREFILGANTALDQVGLSAIEAVELTATAINCRLDNRVIANKQRLDEELAAWIEPRLTPAQQPLWRSPSPFGPGQLLGEAIVSFCLRPAALHGRICFADRRDGETTFARTDQWLGSPLPPADPLATAVALVRRFLTAYGPSTPAHLDEWAGIGPAQAKRLWQMVQAELTEIHQGRRQTWLLTADLPLYLNPPEPAAVRLLPAGDPFLQMRDKATLLPVVEQQRRLWRTVGSPGAVLVQGEVIGTWRSRKLGQRLEVTVDCFAALPSPAVSEVIEAEAVSLAPFRGCTGATLRFSTSKE